MQKKVMAREIPTGFSMRVENQHHGTINTQLFNAFQGSIRVRRAVGKVILSVELIT